MDAFHPFAGETEKDELKRLSRQALENIHEYATFRVNQLADLLENLLFIARTDVFELEDMFHISERIDSSMANKKRYERLREDIEYELLRKSFDEK